MGNVFIPDNRSVMIQSTAGNLMGRQDTDGKHSGAAQTGNSAFLFLSVYTFTTWALVSSDSLQIALTNK